MYNRTGLPSAKGSGTSGYIQRNLAQARPAQSRLQFLKELRRLNANPIPAQLAPAPDIALHRQRRGVYVFLEETREAMRDEGRTIEEIETELKLLEKRLIDKLEKGELVVEGDEGETDPYILAERKTRDNERFREALGIAPNAAIGVAFDFETKEKRRLEERLRREIAELERLQAEASEECKSVKSERETEVKCEEERKSEREERSSKWKSIKSEGKSIEKKEELKSECKSDKYKSDETAKNECKKEKIEYISVDFRKERKRSFEHKKKYRKSTESSDSWKSRRSRDKNEIQNNFVSFAVKGENAELTERTANSYSKQINRRHFDSLSETSSLSDSPKSEPRNRNGKTRGKRGGRKQRKPT